MQIVVSWPSKAAQSKDPIFQSDIRRNLLISVANSIWEKFENYQHPAFYKEILLQRGICKKACKSFHAKNHQISRNNCKVVIHYICSMYIVHLHTQEACSTTAVQEFENDKAKAGIAFRPGGIYRNGREKLLVLF